MLTTSIKLFKAFISDFSAYGNKLATRTFKLGKMQRDAGVLLRAAAVNLRLFFTISNSCSLGDAGVPALLLGSSAPLQDDAEQVPPLW